jgi:hypothetical protein
MYKKSAPKTMLYAVLILIGLATAGCEKLGAPTNSPKQPAIPAALGDLVAVTPGDGPNQSVLWFKQSDQAIVAVTVSVRRGTIDAKMTKFPRS